MPFPIEREHVQHLLEGIEITIAAHLLWIKQFNHSLHFDSAQLEGELDQDARLKSPFGQWYYFGKDRSHLLERPDFESMKKTQHEMHMVAGRLAIDCLHFGKIIEEDYDLFMSLSLQLNATLRSLQMDIIGELLATDPLTGCFGRRGMLLKLRGEQERSERLQKPCCIFLMDFDHFKQVNDTRGHPAGDAVLKQGMRFIASRLRKYDSLYRYGGEEFLACLPDTPIYDALDIVERLRAGLEELAFLPPAGEPFHITASFGLVELPITGPVESAIAAADQALYRAKENGRNRVEVDPLVKNTGHTSCATRAAEAI